jgi:hypothetical protein
VRAGVPERVAMLLTGHKTHAVFERDNIVSCGDLREAARRLDQFRSSIVSCLSGLQDGIWLNAAETAHVSGARV